MSPNIKRRTVEVEYRDNEHVVYWHDGSVSICASPRTVVDGVKDRDARDSKRTGASIVTTIEWRNCPDGFVPPC